MVEDIIRLLGGMRDIVVVSRTSTLGFAGQMPNLRQVEQQLNVQYVLHGSVRRSGQQIRIGVELDDAVSRETLWADRFDGALADVFEMQDEIALRTAGAIAPHLRERQARRAQRKDRNSVNAYDLTLQALARLYPPDRESLPTPKRCCTGPSRSIPTIPAAFSHLAYLHLFRIGQGLRPTSMLTGLLRPRPPAGPSIVIPVMRLHWQSMVSCVAICSRSMRTR